MRGKTAILGAALALLMSLSGCGDDVQALPASTPTPTPGPIWVGAWGASMTNAHAENDNKGGTDRSFRFLVTSTIDGTRARVRFSNVYGTTPVTIGAARLSLGEDGTPRVDAAHDVSLSFAGSRSVTLPPGTTVTSDAADLPFSLGQVLAVSVYLKGAFGPVSRHDSYFITNYESADSAGDTTADVAGSSFSGTLMDWLLVNEVDVYGDYQGTLALFGSSTIDGYKSNYSSDRIYPVPNVPLPAQHANRLSDLMAHRLAAAGYRIGVINAGIPGDTVTAHSGNAPSDPPNANDRIAQDVLTLPNLLGMLSYFGSIDLREAECKSAPEIETATQRLVATAHAARIPIVLATLPPTGLCSNQSQPNFGPLPSPADPYAGGLQPGPPNGAEVQRAAFNQWVPKHRSGASRSQWGCGFRRGDPRPAAHQLHAAALQQWRQLPPYRSGLSGRGQGDPAHIPSLQVVRRRESFLEESGRQKAKRCAAAKFFQQSRNFQNRYPVFIAMHLPQGNRAPGKSFPATVSLSLLSFLLLLTSCTTTGSVSTGTSGTTTGTGSALTMQWVVGWGAPAENAATSTGNPGGSEQSFRFIVLPTTDGTQERIHFSNTLGKGPITIGSARLAAAVGVGPAIDPTRDAPMTFSSSTSVTIPAGQEVVSDPVNVTYAFGEKLAVTVYMKGSFSSLTQHSSDPQINFKTSPGAGDTTTDATGSSFGTTLSEWFMVTAVDVYGSFQGTVAVFGSSSIDGHASNVGDTNSYPVANVAILSQDNDRPSDWLARQLRAAGYRMGVLNAGAIGDPAGENATTAAGTAIAGVDRMKHDVLQQAGIKTVVIYFGGIDLRSDCKPATAVEASLSNMVQQAYTAGVRVILATLPPAEYCQYSDPALLPSSTNPYAGDLYPGPENPGSTQRRLLNDWIRTTAINLPGVVAIADFDKALASTVHPDFMIPNLNSGDNFHPNGTGYGVQSSAIPLDSILGQ